MTKNKQNFNLHHHNPLYLFCTQFFLYVKFLKGYNHDHSQSDISDVFVKPDLSVYVANTSTNIINIFYCHNINTWMYKSSYRKNDYLLLLFLTPITICIFLHIDQIMCLDNQFTRLNCVSNTCSVLLLIVCLRDKLDHIVSHFLFVYYVHGIIVNILNQQCHVVTDAIKYNLVNLLKILTCCCFV